VSEFLKKNSLITKQQHGFIANRSTVTNLTETLNDWTLALDNKSSVTVAYIDFCRAFDSVCHQKLLLKLQSYGLTGTLLEWIHNFLADRSQTTRVGSSYSSFESVISGVVQGSCIGPLLFTVYVNDVVDIMPTGSVSKLYADDLKLYSVVSDYSDRMVIIQRSLDKLSDWSKTWQLQISYKKCSIMEVGRQRQGVADFCPALFNIGQRNLQHAVNVKDLGVIVQSDLKFTAYINQIVAKAHMRASLILKCFISKDPIILTKAFTTYVRPILEYASNIWSPFVKSEVDKLESVQRAFTKRIPALKFSTYGDRLKLLNLESLELRRLRQDLVLTYKILFSKVDIDSKKLFVYHTDTITRGHRFKLYMQRSNTTTRQKFYCNRVVTIWNNLPANDSNFQTLNSFKRFLLLVDLTKYNCRQYD
jgi:hypothetical protein